MTEQMRIDASTFTRNLNDFGVNIVIKTPDSATTLDVIGYHTKHHTSYNIQEDEIVNSKRPSWLHGRSLEDVTDGAEGNQSSPVCLLAYINTRRF